MGIKMAETAAMAVITPSYALDLELCSDLNESVLRNTPAPVRHYIITPRRDLRLFSRLRGTRTEVLSVDEVLPWHVLPVPARNFWLNLRHPWPPVRGWVMQQVIKLQMATQVNADLMLLADSDVRLVRPVASDRFRVDGKTLFYRKDREVGRHMPRHVIWYDVAARLLGVPSAVPPLPDYINPFNVWDRRIVIAMLERVERATGSHWLDAVAGQRHLSEFFLYGVFVDKVLAAQAGVLGTSSMFCSGYWERTPLDVTAGSRFVQGLSTDDVAIMISAKSGTPLDVRRKILAGVSLIRNVIRPSSRGGRA
jgi:hypothetical protein